MGFHVASVHSILELMLILPNPKLTSIVPFHQLKDLRAQIVWPAVTTLKGSKET